MQTNRNDNGTRTLSIVAVLLAVGLTTNYAAGQIATSLVNEGDLIGSNAIGTINNVSANSVGGWATTLNAGSTSYIYGSVDGIAPAGVIFAEGTFGPYVQTSFESRFGMSDSGDVCYSASGSGGPDGTFDSAWVNTNAFALEGVQITTGPLAGLYWSFASAPTMTDTGVGFFSGGTRTTVGGSTSERGLWATTSETPVIYTGDEIPNLPGPVDNGTSIDFDYKVSSKGTEYIVPITMETTGTGIPSTENVAMVISGQGLMLDGALVQEGKPVPAAIGGLAGEMWTSGSFDKMGISDMGEYMFTGDTDATTSEDEFIVLNGMIHIREGDTVDGAAVTGSIEAADMNNSGDWAVVWQISPGGTALIYNDSVVLVIGDLVDFNGDGTIDGGDNNATVSDFEVFSNALIVSDRDGAGNVSIYLPLDVDNGGSLQEGIYQLTFTEAAGPAGDLEIVVSDAPDPQVMVPGPITYTVRVRNNSGAAIDNVVVTSTLDGGLTFNAAASDPIAMHAAGTVTASLGTLAANEVQAYAFVADAAVAGVYSTSSEVVGDSADTVPGNNNVTNETEVGKSSDVSVTITDAPDPLTVPGGAITYTLDVYNDGPSFATDVVVTMNLDPTTAFNAGLSDPAANHAAGVVTINVGELGADTGASYDVVVNVTTQGVISADASVVATESDPVPDNNTDTEDTLFQLTTDLVIAITDAPDPVTPVGGQITYGVVVANDGPSDATGVSASVTLDDSVSVVSVDAPGVHDGSPTGGVITYALGAIPAGTNGVVASIVVDTSAAGRPYCVGEVMGGGFETDPDLTNNTAVVSTLVLDDAQGLAVGVYSNFAASPTSDVPGLPGAKFGTGVDRAYQSPSSNQWILSADTDLGTAVDEVIIIGNICTSGVVIQEGTTPLDQGDFVGFIDQELSINDAGLFTFATNTDAATATDEVIVRSDGSTHLVIAREGNVSPATGGEYGATLAASNIVADGTVWFDADTTLDSTMDRFILSKNGVIVEAQEDVTVPAGQDGGATEPWESFNTGSLRVDATGANYAVIGTTNDADSGKDGVLVINGNVVAQEGVVLPGSGFAGPAVVNTSTEVAMAGSGDWIARGSNLDGDDWVLVNSSVVSRTGDPLVPGAAERYDDASFSTGFFGIALNSAGDYVVASVTDSGEGAANAVLVVNGETIVSRENDPVDLDGNGLMDDGIRIRTYGNDDQLLTEDLQLYFTATVRDFNDDGSNTDIGDVFARINLCGIAGPCGDLDNDKDVDADDFALFELAYGDGPCDADYHICADFDEDGVIALADYLSWVACYRDYVGNPTAPVPAADMGDFDRDSDVDLADYAAFQQCTSEDPASFSCLIRFDFDGDDTVSATDIDGFTQVLVGP